MIEQRVMHADERDPVLGRSHQDHVRASQRREMQRRDRAVDPRRDQTVERRVMDPGGLDQRAHRVPVRARDQIDDPGRRRLPLRQPEFVDDELEDLSVHVGDHGAAAVAGRDRQSRHGRFLANGAGGSGVRHRSR
ncbi:MAG: hypothetical protein IT520_18500 [Burkholderiales bacterium]|nr:hypothetical protein [Burkholderiales bacterium]